MKQHEEMVCQLGKNPEEILDTLSASKVNLWHMATGIATEAGELLDAIKKHVIYNQPLDFDNCVEELGDIEFYLEGFRQELEVTRNYILRTNVEKLSKRYPQGYTDQNAKDRLDKAS